MQKITKQAAAYKLGGRKKCGNCSMFLPKTNKCTLVEGIIRAFMVCKFWEPKND